MRYVSFDNKLLRDEYWLTDNHVYIYTNIYWLDPRSYLDLKILLGYRCCVQTPSIEFQYTQQKKYFIVHPVNITQSVSRLVVSLFTNEYMYR